MACGHLHSPTTPIQLTQLSGLSRLVPNQRSAAYLVSKCVLCFVVCVQIVRLASTDPCGNPGSARVGHCVSFAAGVLELACMMYDSAFLSKQCTDQDWRIAAGLFVGPIHTFFIYSFIIYHFC
jgi:hypothetical protein